MLPWGSPRERSSPSIPRYTSPFLFQFFLEQLSISFDAHISVSLFTLHNSITSGWWVQDRLSFLEFSAPLCPCWCGAGRGDSEPCDQPQDVHVPALPGRRDLPRLHLQEGAGATRAGEQRHQEWPTRGSTVLYRTVLKVSQAETGTVPYCRSWAPPDPVSNAMWNDPLGAAQYCTV